MFLYQIFAISSLLPEKKSELVQPLDFNNINKEELNSALINGITSGLPGDFSVSHLFETKPVTD